MTTPAHPIIYSNTVEDAEAEFLKFGWYIHKTVHDLLKAEGGVFSIIKKIHHTDPDPNITETSPHITVVFIDNSKIAYYYKKPSHCGFQWAAPEPTSSGRGCGVERDDQLSTWFLTSKLFFPRSYLLSRLTNYLDSYPQFRESRAQLSLDIEKKELASRCRYGNDYVPHVVFMRYLTQAEYMPEWKLPEFIKGLIERARRACYDMTSVRHDSDSPRRATSPRRDRSHATSPLSHSPLSHSPLSHSPSLRSAITRGRSGGRKLSTRKLSTRKLSTRKLSKRKLSKRKLSKRKLSKRKH